jgi:hypothetical protein
MYAALHSHPAGSPRSAGPSVGRSSRTLRSDAASRTPDRARSNRTGPAAAGSARQQHGKSHPHRGPPARHSRFCSRAHDGVFHVKRPSPFAGGMEQGRSRSGEANSRDPSQSLRRANQSATWEHADDRPRLVGSPVPCPPTSVTDGSPPHDSLRPTSRGPESWLSHELIPVVRCRSTA